jgi:hypothetical protein
MTAHSMVAREGAALLLFAHEYLCRDRVASCLVRGNRGSRPRPLVADCQTIQAVVLAIGAITASAPQCRLSANCRLRPPALCKQYTRSRRLSQLRERERQRPTHNGAVRTSPLAAPCVPARTPAFLGRARDRRQEPCCCNRPRARTGAEADATCDFVRQPASVGRARSRAKRGRAPCLAE